eukprot:3854528-Pleurochrysis_carterae.AAC.1
MTEQSEGQTQGWFQTSDAEAMAAQVRKNGDMRAFGGCQVRPISGLLRGVMSFGWCHMLIPLLLVWSVALSVSPWFGV